MEKITKYSDYLNEATVEVDETEEGVYVLTLQDVKDIVKNCSSLPNENGDIDDETILTELENYKFVKVEDSKITKVDEPLETEETEEIDELSSDDEDPTFIKKFEEL